ncbi:MAG TPA: tripartite tricarboxylate transporter TctB family protein [Pseudaminobacter sp.]|jgi:hypothetical protein|nr:tripartite tricarboxylate transporter TctB family protein [Pseudaminobacter sp.]
MKADRILGAGFVLLGFAMIWLMYRLAAPSLGQGDPGPAVLPAALGILFVLLGGILAIRRVAPSPPAVEAGAGENADTATLIPAEPALFSIIHLVNFCAYVALFEKAGFSLSTFVFLSIAIFLFGPRTVRSAIVAILAAAVVTFVVGTGLRVLVGVPLPGVFLG